MSTSRETRHRLVLRVLDHQIVGPEGQLLGNVDDLQVLIDEDGWHVTGLLVGPAALGHRLPGKVGRWTTDVWRRLQTAAEPEPALVPMSQVTDIASAIGVASPAAESLAASFGLELWLRRFVISRIPGAKGGTDEEPASADREHGPRRPPQPPVLGASSTTVSALLGLRVLARDGDEIGVVNELLCVEPADGPRDHLEVTHVEYSRHPLGSELGYNSDSGQGPRLVGALIRRWQRSDRVAPIGHVSSVDLDGGTLTVGSHLDHVHPHQL